MTERIRRPKFEEKAQSSIWNLFSPPRPLGASDMPDAIEAKIRATLGRFSVAKPFLGGNVLGISKEEFQSQPDNYLTVPSEKAGVILSGTSTYMDVVSLEEKHHQSDYGHKSKTLLELNPPIIQKITEDEPKPPIPNGFDFLESLLQTPKAERQHPKAVDILKDDLDLSDTSRDSDEAPNETKGSKDSLKWLLDLSLSEEEAEVSNRRIKGSVQEQNSKFHKDTSTAPTNRGPPELFKNLPPIGLAKPQGIPKADLELSDISDYSDAFDAEVNASKDSLKWLQDLSLSEDEEGVDQKPKGRIAHQEMENLGNGMLTSSSAKENSNSVRNSRKIETSLEVLRGTIVPKLCQTPISPIKPEAPCTNQDVKARIAENDATRTPSAKISKSEPAPRDVRTSGVRRASSPQRIREPEPAQRDVRTSGPRKSVPSINGVRRASSPQRIRKPEPAKATASANDMKRDAETARKTSNQSSLPEPSKKHASLEHSLTAATNGTKNTLLKKTDISKPVPPETSVFPTKPKPSYESSSTQSAPRPTGQESREISVKQKLIAEHFSALSKAPLLIRPAKEMPQRNSLPALPKLPPAEPKQMPLSNCQRRPFPTRRTVLNKNISKGEDDPLLNLFCRKGTIDQIRLSKKRKLSEESTGSTEIPAAVKPQELKFAPCRLSTTSSSDEHQTTASSSERENTSDYESSAKRTSSERSFPIEKEKVSEYKQNYHSKLETLPEGKVLEMKSKSTSSRESSKSKCLTSDYESSSQGTSSEESEPRSKKIKIDDRQETILEVEKPKSDGLSSNTFAEAPRKGENKSKDDTYKRKHKKHRSKERKRSRERERAKKEQEDNGTPEHRDERIREYDVNSEHQEKKSEKSKHKDKKREREHHKSKNREKQSNDENNAELITQKQNGKIRTLQSEEKGDKLTNHTQCEKGVTTSKRISLTDYLKRSEKEKPEEPSLLRPIDQKNKVIEENRENCKINEDHLRREHQREAVTKEHSKRKDSLSSTSSGSSSTKSGQSRDHEEKRKHNERLGREKHRGGTVKDNKVHRTDQQKQENRKHADSHSSTSSHGIPIREEKQKIKDSSSSSSNFTNEDKVNEAVTPEDIRQKTNYQEQVQREHRKRENSLSSISSASMSECEDPVGSTVQKRDPKKAESLGDVSISKPGEKQTVQNDSRHRADPQEQLSQGIRKHEDSGRRGVHGWSNRNLHDNRCLEEQLLKENGNRTESLSSTSSGSSTSRSRPKGVHGDPTSKPETSTSSMDSRSKYHVKHQEPLLQRNKPEDFITSACSISTAASREQAKYLEEKPTSEGNKKQESATSMSSNLQEPIRIKVGERENSLSSSGTTPHNCRVMEPFGDKPLLKVSKGEHHRRAKEEEHESRSEKMKKQQDLAVENHRNYQPESVLGAARKPAEYMSSTAKYDEEQQQEEHGSWPSTSSRTTREYGNGYCFTGKQEKEVLKRDQGTGNHHGVEAAEKKLQSLERPVFPTATLHQKPTESLRDEEKESSRHKRSKEKKKKKHKDRGRSRSREKKRSSKKKKRNRSRGEEESRTPTISEKFQDDAGHLSNKQELFEQVDSPQPTMEQPVSIQCSIPLSRLLHVNPAWFRQNQGATEIETPIIEEDQNYSEPLPAEDLHYTKTIAMEQRHYARDIATKELQYIDPTVLEAQHCSEQRGLLSLRPDPRENELACNILSSLMNF